MKKTFHSEMILLSMLSLNEKETVMCSLKKISGGKEGQDLRTREVLHHNTRTDPAKLTGMAKDVTAK